MSVIGVRLTTPYAFEQFRSSVKSEERYKNLINHYNKSRSKGVAGVNQILGSDLEIESKRYHHEAWYAKMQISDSIYTFYGALSLILRKQTTI